MRMQSETRGFRRAWWLAVALAIAGFGPEASAQPQADAGGWLHVHIEGAADEGERMALNLPLGAVGAVLAMAPRGMVSSDGQLVIPEEHGVSVSELRTMWRELMAAGDSEFVTMQRADQSVRVARTGEQVQVRVTGPEETVSVDLPVAVVDALLSGEGDTLNLSAALDELRELRGDIVRVVEQRRQIRVWVDEQAEQ